VTEKIFWLGQILSVPFWHRFSVMGFLVDLDFPQVVMCHARPARARNRRWHIETDTSIVPQPVAMNLWEKASAWLDVESPVPATPSPMRLTRARQHRPRIETDTPLVTWALASAIWEEASVWLEAELPRSWIVILAVRANEIYAHNPRFRQLIRRQGNAGRDWLWVFTRHWLSAILREHDNRLYARLPASYSAGADLPNHASTRTILETNLCLGAVGC
jgi:hypothetical protein